MMKMMTFITKGRTSSYRGYIYNSNPAGLSGNKAKMDALQQSAYLGYDKIQAYVEEKVGKTDLYYESLAFFYCVCQKYLIQWLHQRKQDRPDLTERKERLKNLHQILKKRGHIRSTEYRWRKYFTPLVLFLAGNSKER